MPELGDVSGHLISLLTAQPEEVLDHQGVHHGLLGSSHLGEELLVVLHVPQ
jgi:hypothetical protein